MDVTIVGGHGQIALLLAKRLSDAGHLVRATHRKPEHAADIEATGARPVLVDLEAEDDGPLVDAVQGADAVVFAAGAGPGSGDARKRTVDLGAAVALIAAARKASVPRYVMVSAMGLDRARDGGDMGVYLQAKLDADEALMASDLGWTIVRPGRLTDLPATGTVSLGDDVGYGEVPRDDVAAVLHAVLEADTAGVVAELVGGDVPVADAVAALSV